MDLKVEANMVHVEGWHTQALNSHSFDLLPVVMDVIQHVYGPQGGSKHGPCRGMDLKVEANMVHVEGWHTQALNSHSFRPSSSGYGCHPTCCDMDLKVEANMVHVEGWHTQALNSHSFRPSSKWLWMSSNMFMDLKVEANMVHVEGWHTQALNSHSFRPSSEWLWMSSNMFMDLKVEANMVHVEGWHTQALNSHSFSLLPVVMDVIQHVVSDSTLS
ncbi:unnamed protein product [Sphenostylis stenocarpa]|uniref:Uncharacterized protein n=1 Tax=Sphenostylis stenocarpa TaxID=92480 RepID=A0AA86VEK8_9FABA|nr:unnamed protein product [Sphenostylis stenocarpa]